MLPPPDKLSDINHTVGPGCSIRLKFKMEEDVRQYGAVLFGDIAHLVEGSLDELFLSLERSMAKNQISLVESITSDYRTILSGTGDFASSRRARDQIYAILMSADALFERARWESLRLRSPRGDDDAPINRNQHNELV
jgi:hypothetical protein